MPTGSIYKDEVPYYMMDEIEEAKGPGRPRKNPSERIPWLTKSFYFPTDKRHKVVWDEFDRICKEQPLPPELYNKNKFWRKGLIIRELIIQWVYSHTRKQAVKEVIDDLLRRIHNDRIKRYEKDTGKKYRARTSQQSQEEQTQEPSDQEEAQDQEQSQEGTDAGTDEAPSAEELNN